MKRVKIAYLLIAFSIFSCVGLSRAESLPDPNDLNSFLTFYYLKPNPNKAPAVLENLISSRYFKSDEFSKNNADYIIAYAFGRIAQLNPAIIEDYKKIFDKSSHKGRELILKIFQVCGNEDIRDLLMSKQDSKKYKREKIVISKILNEGIPIEFNLIANKVANANDLDFLWSEFMITGNEAAVKKIIDVLGWPDITREKLQVYLNKNISSVEEEKISKVLEEIGIKCDIAQKKINTVEDLDMIGANYLRNRPDIEQPSQAFIDFRKIIGLVNDDIYYIGIKGSAAWSLYSNAGQHRKVFEICDAEIPNHADIVKIVLLRISAFGYMTDGDVLVVINRLKQLISVNPEDEWGHFSLGSAYLENKDLQSASNEAKILQVLNTKLASDLVRSIDYAKQSSKE